jgi:predicted Zn finger-like uncharacterized protein
MSLATRCFACGTVFRVVQDQLKVSEGWVRCGRCNEVFNALENLFDLERDPPPEWSPGEPVPVDVPMVAAGPVHVGAAPDPFRVDRLDAQLIGARRSESGSTPATRIGERDRLEFPDAQFEPESAASDIMMPIHDTTLALASEPDATSPPAPEFMRHAQRRARRETPAMRAALSGAGLILLASLTLQAAHHFRDTVATRWPETKPALVVWCALLSCSIQAPRRIEDIAVESTALTRIAGAEAFRLAVTLRNRGAMALALPSIDLGLTDAAGLLVARRMLAPEEWHVAAPTLQAGAELPLQLLLATGSVQVTGYTVEIFYP